jgi:uncharacterized protein YegP (UPF0339 family)
MGKFEAYEDENGRWRWRLWSDEGRIVASSGEAYASPAGALHAAEAVRGAAGGAVVTSALGLGIKAAGRLRELLADSPPLAESPPRRLAPAPTPAASGRRRLRVVAPLSSAA